MMPQLAGLWRDRFMSLEDSVAKIPFITTDQIQVDPIIRTAVRLK